MLSLTTPFFRMDFIFHQCLWILSGNFWLLIDLRAVAVFKVLLIKFPFQNFNQFITRLAFALTDTEGSNLKLFVEQLSTK